MLGFADIRKELSFQDREGIPSKVFAKEYALKNRPLDFIYPSTEAVTSFVVVSVDLFGRDIEIFTLSNSLINWDGVNFICNGQTDYSTNLDSGTYYFLINGNLKSDHFCVLPDLVESIAVNIPIAASGLTFFDNTIDIPWSEKSGKPWPLFGIELAENSTPLQFSYLSSDAISSFKAIKVDNNLRVLSETILLTSLVSSDGSYHECTGLVDYGLTLECGVYYFKINGRYESELFGVVELDNFEDALLLEFGDFLLLETGFKLLLE